MAIEANIIGEIGMSIERRTYTNVVFERQGASNHYYTVVATDLDSKEEADNLAHKLSRENLGTLYVPARLYKNTGVRVSSLLKLLNWWKVKADDTGRYED
jgi:hypothetical protein